MKTKYILTLGLAMITLLCQAQQDYRLHFPKGKLVIKNVNGVNIEAYDGDEIIVVTDVDDDGNSSKCEEKTEKTKGLRRISGTGEMDNTGLGLSIVENGNTLEVTQVLNAFHSIDAYIRVPKDVSIKYTNSNVSASDITIRGVSSELEISQSYSDVELIDVTGPMTVQSIYGDVDLDFISLQQSGSVSINATYGEVDLSMPKNSKANMLMKTGFGEAYTDFDIKVDRKITDDDRDKLSKENNSDQDSKSDQFGNFIENIVEGALNATQQAIGGIDSDAGFGSYIKGTINGGGVDVIIRCSYGDIYLRGN